MDLIRENTNCDTAASVLQDHHESSLSPWLRQATFVLWTLFGSANCNCHAIMLQGQISLFTAEQYRELQQVIETRITVQLANLKAHVDHKLGRLSQTVNHRLEEVENDIRTLHNRLDQTESRLEDIEQRLGTVETRLDTIETRLNAIETRLDTITKTLEKPISRMDNFHEMLKNKTQEAIKPSTAVVMELDTPAGNSSSELRSSACAQRIATSVVPLCDHVLWW
ncbi:hypothetical protein BDZ91DRAFT_91850 [Kalaharituber pfeilii]|nr:hypothetical protein BDZ91DRAFT_91850 [Kalaharituber pfeilii]